MISAMDKKAYRAPNIDISVIQPEQFMTGSNKLTRTNGNAGFQIGGGSTVQSRSPQGRNAWSSGWDD